MPPSYIDHLSQDDEAFGSDGLNCRWLFIHEHRVRWPPSFPRHVHYLMPTTSAVKVSRDFDAIASEETRSKLMIGQAEFAQLSIR